MPLVVLASLAPGPADAGAPAMCDGREATIVGTDGDDDLVGTSGNDVILGLAGPDRIDGGGGDDRICGGPGADVLSGGPGDDRLHGGADHIYADQGGPGIAGDILAGGPGDDLLDAVFFVGEDTGNFPNTLTFADAAGPVRVVLRADGYADGEGHDTIVATDRLTVIGSPYADTIVGSTGDDSVIGGLGNDRIRTRGGDDEVLTEDEHWQVGADDEDHVVTGPGNDEVSSYGGPDRLNGEEGRDVLVSVSDDPVVILGGKGRDQVNAQLPHEAGQAVDGGDGADTVVLTSTTAGEQVELRRPGHILVVGGDSGVRSIVGSFTRFLLEGPADWVFVGARTHEEVIATSAGSADVRTKGGDDEVWASGGTDHLDGGAGDDTVHGVGAGDTCREFETGTC